jgi:hypothetical protein
VIAPGAGSIVTKPLVAFPKATDPNVPEAPIVTAFGRERVQVPLDVIVHVPDAVIWPVVPKIITLVTPLPVPEKTKLWPV